jgi:hypothetical protein
MTATGYFLGTLDAPPLTVQAASYYSETRQPHDSRPPFDSKALTAMIGIQFIEAKFQ